MKKELFKFTLLIFILITSLIILFLTINKNLDKEQQVNKNSEKKDLLLDLYLTQIIEEGISNNNLSLNLQSFNNFNSNGKESSTKIGKPVLLYKYSAFSCDICVNFGIKKLNEFFNDKDITKPIIVISDYPEMYKPKHEQYINLGKGKLNMPLEETQLPFYFVLVNGKVKDVFVPEKALPEFTDIYLALIKKKYFTE